MLAGRALVKQYVVQIDAGQLICNLTPYNPNRVSLDLQVTGNGSVRFRWDTKVQGEGGDFSLAPGQSRSFHAPCPTAQLSFWAAAETTVAVMEGNAIAQASNGVVS